MTTLSDPAPPDDVPIRCSTDQYDNRLALQVLRLYASPTTVSYFVLQRLNGQALPTFATFVENCLRLRN